MTDIVRKRKLMITGVSGLLGSNLAYSLSDAFDVFGTYNLHKVKIDGVRTEKLDLLSTIDVANVIKKFSLEYGSA